MWKKKFIWIETTGRIGDAICVQTGRKKAPSYAKPEFFECSKTKREKKVHEYLIKGSATKVHVATVRYRNVSLR